MAKSRFSSAVLPFSDRLLETSLTTGDEHKGFGEAHGESATTVSAAMAFELSNMTAVLELNGEYGDEGDEAYITAGVVSNLSSNTEIQAGISTGLTDDSADWGFIVKWNIELKSNS
jgi:hypothetical protein